MQHRQRIRIGSGFVALLILGAALGSGLGDQGWLHRLAVNIFGPPAVASTEAYAATQQAQPEAFDHSTFDLLLKKHVDEHGWVDYKALAEDAAELDGYIATLADAPFDALGRDQKLALLINAYNAFTLRLILDHYPTESIYDIPDAQRWDAKRWVVSGKTYSLNQIEHELIRPKFVEPRIHFALVCAAYSCPKLRNEAFTGDKLEAQLADQTTYTHTHDRWFRYDTENNTVYLTALYDWYGGDFEAVSGSVLSYVADHVPALRKALDSGRDPNVRWIEYDWKLNDIHNVP